MGLKRRESSWTEKTLLVGLLVFSFLLLKNFLCVLGNQLLWLCISSWIQPLHSLRSHTAYSLPTLQHVKRNWLQRPACSRNPLKIQHCKYCTQQLVECMYTTHTHKTYIYLPVWLLCACVREARQRESSRPHTPTPQMQGPRSRILSERERKHVMESICMSVHCVAFFSCWIHKHVDIWAVALLVQGKTGMPKFCTFSFCSAVQEHDDADAHVHQKAQLRWWG